MRAPRFPGWTDGLVLGLLTLVVVFALDLVLGPGIVISSSYAIGAVVAGALTTVRRTAVVAGLSILIAILSGFWDQHFGTLDWFIRLVLNIALCAVALGIAAIRTRREQDLRHMTVIAETAQRAVLRAMPSAVGSVGFAARYISATREAQIGGDLYEVTASPYGVRVIVGDVRGKGLDAVQMAATVLGAFRRNAYTEPSLAEVAVDLDQVVSGIAGDEDFVTALLAEFRDDHSVLLVNCGHHPPLVVAATGTATLAETGEPQPPLGLGSRPGPVACPWPADARILLYTDGVVETRDERGRFFPLVDHAGLLRQGTLDEALDKLVEQLAGYAAGRRLTDDMALVLAEQPPSGAASAAP